MHLCMCVFMCICVQMYSNYSFIVCMNISRLIPLVCLGEIEIFGWLTFDDYTTCRLIHDQQAILHVDTEMKHILHDPIAIYSFWLLIRILYNFVTLCHY